MSDDACSRRRATTTRRVARTFSLACRLLPRDVRDDVYLLYLVFRTLDDLVDDGDPDADGAGRGGRGVVPAGGGARTREVARARATSRRATRCRATRSPTSAPGCATTSTASRSRTEDELDALLLPVAGTVGVVMAAMLGMRRPGARAPAAAALGMAMQRTNILRDIDEDLAAGRVYLAARDGRALRRLARARRAARRCCATRSRAPTRSTSAGVAGIPLLRHGRRAIGRGRGDVPRDPAPDRARGLRRVAGPGRRRAAGASCSIAARRGVLAR